MDGINGPHDGDGWDAVTALCTVALLTIEVFRLLGGGGPGCTV